MASADRRGALSGPHPLSKTRRSKGDGIIVPNPLIAWGKQRFILRLVQTALEEVRIAIHQDR
jgi:hypothetical protein